MDLKIGSTKAVDKKSPKWKRATSLFLLASSREKYLCVLFHLHLDNHSVIFLFFSLRLCNGICNCIVIFFFNAPQHRKCSPPVSQQANPAASKVSSSPPRREGQARRRGARRCRRLRPGGRWLSSYLNPWTSSFTLCILFHKLCCKYMCGWEAGFRNHSSAVYTKCKWPKCHHTRKR